MEISDAIDILHDLADELNGLIDESCICFEPQEDQVEAIYLATRILSALDANKAKAENIVQAVRICYAPGPWKNAKSARTTTMTAKAMAANRIRILWICLCRYTRKEAMENEAT